MTVAIVGAGCRFPGGVTDLESFDRLLRNGVDAIQEIPSDRWSIPAFASPHTGIPGKTYSRWGGFVEGIADFEPEAFGISAREAAVMDPQQRMLLEVVWNALEDAAIPINELAGSRTGVFVGISTFDYSQLQAAPHSKRSLQSFTALGTSLSIAANRVSYCLDLRGPSVSVDTACSSSLVALDRAVRSLQSGECDLAIACGVNALLMPDVFVSFSAASMLSPDGRCKAFDSSANGFVRAEGAAALVLRPTHEARSRRDRIHARILGSGINQDGRTTGLAMPNGQAQSQLLREVYTRSGIDPSSVGYVEAHGTGTAVGDPVEAKAIGEVFSAGRDASRPLPIGSVKTNIGHLEAASGMAGVLKALLSLKHRTIYRNLHFHQPNPRIDFETLRLRVPTQTEPWPGSQRPAIAAVNSFGFGGTNAHVVLAENDEEPSPIPFRSEEGCSSRYVLPITARNDLALTEVAGAFLETIRHTEPGTLTSICRTAALRRTHYSRRLCIAGDSQADLTGKLQRFIKGDCAAGIRTGNVRSGSRPLVFVFSGQGSQYPRMGLELMQREPVFREMAIRCDETIRRYTGWSVLHEMELEPEASRIHETYVAQPALFTVQVALAALWQSWGIVPSAAIGHSVGEVAAAWMTGALDFETACLVIAGRSSAMQTAQSGGKMAAVALTRGDGLQCIERFNGTVALAAVNSPKQITLSGDASAMEELARDLERDNVWFQFLQVSHAFHSADMDAAEALLRSRLSNVSSNTPHCRLISSVTGEPVQNGSLNTDYWWRNVRQPVLFEQAARTAMRDTSPVFLEIGPHPVMTAALMDCARAEQAEISVWPSLRRGADSKSTLLDSVCGLFASGATFDWNALIPGEGEPVDLPPHPWHRDRYWNVNAEIAAALNPQKFHPLLGFRRTSAVTTWEQTLDVRTFPWLDHHRVKSSAVIPGAAYVEMILAAIASIREPEPGAAICLDNLQFQRALFLGGDSAAELQVTASLENHTVDIHSRSSGAESAPWVRNVAADWFVAGVAPPSADLDTIRQRCAKPTSVEEVYEKFARMGLEYGPSFRANRELWTGRSEALARIEIDPTLAVNLETWWCHPTILDACFQVCCVPLTGKSLDILKLPVSASHIRIWGRAGAEVWCHAQLTSESDYATEADIHFYDGRGTPLGLILGFRLQRASGATTATTPRGAEAYSTQWKSSPVQSTAANSLPSTWLVFIGANGMGEDISRKLQSGGSRVIRVAPGLDFTPGDNDEFVIDPGNSGHLARLLQSLPSETVPVRVLYLWALEVSSAGDVIPFATDSMLAVVAPFALMQAIGVQNRIAVSDFVFITVNSRQVLPEDKPDHPTSMGLLGLGRVAAHEFPSWRFKHIDLSQSPGSDDMEGLVHEILIADVESESAWRNGQRFVPRLEHGPVLEEYAVAANDVSAFRLISRNSVSFDSLQWIPQVRRIPGPLEVEIRVDHVALNFRDLLKCVGMYPASRPEELDLGDEFAGVIIATGSSVTGFAPGDRVACCAPGCFQSRIVVPATALFPVSANWSPSDAATIPIAFLTAWYSFHVVGRLCAGESVLIHSATGGVGMAAVQIAKAAGARIFATAGTHEKREMLRNLGCELVMDSRSLTFSDEIRTHTNGAGVDVILNSLAGEAMVQSVAVLAPYGRFLELGKRDLFGNSRMGLWPLRLNASFHAIDLGAVLQEKPALAKRLFREVRSAFESGTLRPLSHTVWPASKVQDAFRTMSQGKHVGKLVIGMNDPELMITSTDVPRIGFRDDATYVVTGGASGFGLETAKWIAHRGGRHIAVLSRRSPESESFSQALEQIRACGADARGFSCDVADRCQLREVLDEKLRGWPPVRGIFHAAMVMDDAALINLDAPRVRRVLEPKALGAWNLHQETHEFPLDHFVLFSSVSAAVGNPGQSAYAAANAMLEGLAEYRRSVGLPAMAVGWGFVSDHGFAARQADLVQRAKKHGFHGVPATAYLDVLERLMARHCSNVVIGDFDWNEIAKTFRKSGVSRGLLTALTGELSSHDAVAASGLRIRESLETASGEQRVILMRAYLQSQLARILRVSPDKVDTDRPIAELGLDSLMGIELATIVEQDCATSVPSLATSRDLTVNGLVRIILKQMGYVPEAEVTKARGVSLQSRPATTIVALRAGGSRPPLFCFHPIGGSIRGYKALTDALAANIPVFGVQSRTLSGEPEYSTLDQMAAAYAAEVRAFAPDGPYYLFGHSLGGYLAARVAQNLEAAGGNVSFVGIADCPDWTTGTVRDTHNRLASLIVSSYQEAVKDMPFLKPLEHSDRASLDPVVERLVAVPEQGPATLLAWLTSERFLHAAPQQSLLSYLERLASHLVLINTVAEIPLVEGPLILWQSSRGIGAGPDRWRRRHDLPVCARVIEADHAALMNAPAVDEIASDIALAYTAGAEQ